MARPTAVPRMPASASGVSTQRSGPNLSRRPAVARKTPPARPTSSPMTMTASSRSISTWRASLTASTRVLLGIGVLRHELGVRLGQSLGGCDSLPERLLCLVGDRLGEVVSEQACPAEVALVAPEALVLPFELDALSVDVGARIVGRRMRSAPVGHRFDERGALAGARACERVARGLVDSQHVAPVDAYSRHPVAGRLVDERSRTGLGRERRRDRPAVVVTEENDGGGHDGGEVGALVEGALRGGAVAEERDRTPRFVAELLSPREADRVRDVRRDRNGDRGHAVPPRIPPTV